MHKSFYTTYTILVTLALLLAACNLPLGGGGGAATPPPGGAPGLPETGNPPAGGAGGVTYTSYPTDPTTILAATKDEVFPSSYGDDHSIDLYERPFQLDNTYRPDADIIWAFISDEGEWFYFSTQIVGANPATNTMDAPYGIELDIDLDGRGDFLIWATPPYTTNWTKENIQLFTDTNNDVGNLRPLLSDAPSKGNGYETLLFDRGSGADPDTAWVRQSPLDLTYLQIAVKRNVIADTDFLWAPWTDFGMANPGLFDYHDFFTTQEAGSPYASSPDAPLKALFGMDNTCRVAYGFTPVGTEPGLCGGAPSAAVPTQKPGGGYTGIPVLVQQTPTFTPPVPSITQPPPPPPTKQPPAATGVIAGFVYWDMNADGVQDAGEAGESSQAVYLYREGCAYALTMAYPDSNGAYSFSNLALGTYCVQYAPPPGYSLGSPGGVVDHVGVNDVMPSRVDFRILPPG